MAQLVKTLPAMQETLICFPGWEDPLEESMATHSNISSIQNPHAQRSLVGCSPWGHKE